MHVKKYKILIVEDEYIPANYIKKILEQHGHTVLGIADSKEKALKYVNSIPELILMDIKIKGTADGIETAKAFLKHNKVAIIYLSAYIDESFLSRVKETHPIGYLVKPVQAQTLISTIDIGMDNFKVEKLSDKIILSEETYFNINEHYINTNEEIIKLSRQESILLSTLIKNKKKLLSDKALEDIIWPDEPSSSSALRTTIWRLRKKLPQTVKINNLNSCGYKINF